MKFEKKCCRCGYCCLSEVCLSGLKEYGALEPCHGLTFRLHRGKLQAKCQLVKKDLVPVGEGCCISARAYRNGIEHDFATLPDSEKRLITRQKLSGIGTHLSSKKLKKVLDNLN